MEKEEIMKTLVDKLGEGRYMLSALQRYEKEVNRSPTKHQLMALTNELYELIQEKRKTQSDSTSDVNKEAKLIGSRHTLDVFAARLEGGGFVDVEEVGRIRVYRLSQLGREIIEFMKDRGLSKPNRTKVR